MYVKSLLRSVCKSMSRIVYLKLTLRFNRTELNGDVTRVLRMNNAKECIIQERINRFTVKIILDGNVQRAYINNTGRLLDFIVEGRKGFCVEHERKAKTDCRLFAVKEKNLAAIIDTQLQMKALEKTIMLSLTRWSRRCWILRRNPRLGSSILDYLLECSGEKIYLEVKSAVLRNGKYAVYPDCPSLRGRRHISEITDHVKNGGRGMILFIAALPNVEAFKPNSSVDPEITRLLMEAREAGVEIRAIELYYDPRDFFIYLSKPDLPVELFS